MRPHHPHRFWIFPLCLAAGALALFVSRGPAPAELVQQHPGAPSQPSTGGPTDRPWRPSSGDRATGPSLTGSLARVLDGAGVDDAQAAPAAPAAVPAPAAPLDREALRRAVAEFEKGKENAFFSPREAARKLLAPETRGDSVRGLRDMLRDTAELKALPPDVRYLTQQPGAVTARMAALDLFFAMADEDAQLIEELAALVAEPLDPSLADHVARVVMAEKYESLTKLGSLDFQFALKTFLALADPQIQAILKPALIEGLASTGITYTEAEAVVDQATHPA